MHREQGHPQPTDGQVHGRPQQRVAGPAQQRSNREGEARSPRPDEKPTEVAMVTSVVGDVQAFPYSWPGAPDADSVKRTGHGTCAAKHALLREQLTGLGVRSRRLMVVGPLAPPLWPDLAAEAGGLLEVHECLTVETAAGPLLVDVTWHPAAIQAGLPGTLDWDGTSNMRCAVDLVEAYAVGDDDFRVQKERLRARLYTSADRTRRNRILAEISRRASAL